ncbi:MAG: oxidoreductase domain protein [Chloroflexi bacterium]|nr:oxidoreductase domain protein [Chloroflexota bacterium]
MSEQRLRLALVGAGRRGQAHAATIAGLSDLYDLVAVCDPIEQNAERIARGVGAAVHTDVLQCFSKERLDAVAIVTPPETHHLLAKAAADRGLHMFIETPLAPTRAMMDFIAEAAARASVHVEVGENYSRRPAERLTQAALASGSIGQLLHLSAFNAAANHDSCYHLMSLFLAYAASDVTQIHAISHPHPLGVTRSKVAAAAALTETWADAVLTFASGVTASLNYVTSWTFPIRSGRPRIVSAEGTEGYIVKSDASPDRLHRVENGSARDYIMQVATHTLDDREIPTRYYFDTDPSIEVSNPFADRALADVEPVGVADGLARAAELVSLHRAVTAGLTPEYGIERARRSQELGIAVIESARLAQPISGKLGAETAWEREHHQMLSARWSADPLREMDRILRDGVR